ncbi:hypothetical protein K449DRAFT_263145 [Hypoxylon sp. EC38]|nr:hypothetical protein K449DRAFT_263145 [Hypoxylon sp. EC38]
MCLTLPFNIVVLMVFPISAKVAILQRIILCVGKQYSGSYGSSRPTQKSLGGGLIRRRENQQCYFCFCAIESLTYAPPCITKSFLIYAPSFNTHGIRCFFYLSKKAQKLRETTGVRLFICPGCVIYIQGHYSEVSFADCIRLHSSDQM